MNLRELQSAVQGAVLSGGVESNDPILAAIHDSTRTDRATLFDVYVAAYRLRLAEFLSVDYPALRAMLGAPAFDELAEDYISSQPSNSRNARWYSTRLPDFMSESDAWRDPRAISLAKFERALTDAFDARDAQALPISALGALPPESWPALAFDFHPSLALLDLAPGATAAHQAYVAAEEAAAGETGDESDSAEADAGLDAENDAGGPTAIWRANGDAVYRELEADEFLALNEAMNGQTFGAICQMVAFAEEPEVAPQRLAQFLASWFTDGLIIGVHERAP